MCSSKVKDTVSRWGRLRRRVLRDEAHEVTEEPGTREPSKTFQGPSI